MADSPPPFAYIRLHGRYRCLCENRRFSWDKIRVLRRELAAALDSINKDHPVAVAAAGSLGRLEASENSDADFLVFSADPATAKRAKDTLFPLAEKLGLKKPNATGVFSEEKTLDELIASIGKINEDIITTSQRLLMLLESRPLFNDAEYKRILDAIFDRYTASARRDPHKLHPLLMNDLIKYFRIVCVGYEAKLWGDPQKWALRYLKLRHSRIILYAGLLFLLGAATLKPEGERIAFLRDHLSLTPLERVALAYDVCKSDDIFRVVGPYNVFLSCISDPEARKQLYGLDYERRYESDLFANLKFNSDALISELMSFLMAQQGVWSRRFYEYLIF